MKMYEKVLDSVRQWLIEVSKKYVNTVKFEIIDDNTEILTVNFETVRFIAQLNVSEHDFRPYRYIEFYALDNKKDLTELPAYVYHDTKDDSISDIIYNLNNAMNFIIQKSY
jgi:hypothetical protein